MSRYSGLTGRGNQELQQILGHRGIVRETRTVEEIVPAVREFLARDVRYWVSDGGDGALHWLVNEAQRATIEPAVMAGYEHAFKAELQRLIARTRDAALRAKFQEMLSCPIRNARGQCVSFTDYVVGALIKNGIHRRYDMEAALSYIFEKMVMDKSDTGESRTTLFGGFDDALDRIGLQSSVDDYHVELRAIQR